MDKPVRNEHEVSEELSREYELEEALLKVEETISRFLAERLSRGVDYRLVLKVERTNGLTLLVDIELLSSRKEELVRLKPLIDDAVRLAKKVFEESISRGSQ